MKKLALVLAVLASSLAVNAQNVPLASARKIVADNSKITFDMPISVQNRVDGKGVHPSDTTYKSSPYIVYNNMSVNQLLNTTATVNPDRMPIAKPANTDPRMPIVQTDKTGYTMPVVGKTQPRVYYQSVSPKKAVDGAEVRP